MKGNLGQFNRSKVNVTRSENVLMDISMMGCLLELRDGRDESSCQESESLKRLRNMTTCGILKAYTF